MLCCRRITTRVWLVRRTCGQRTNSQRLAGALGWWLLITIRCRPFAVSGSGSPKGFAKAAGGSFIFVSRGVERGL